MPASSASCSAKLESNAGARRLVLGTGIAFACTGALVLATLPVTALLRALLAVVWCGWAGAELLAARRAYRTCAGYVLAPGGAVEIVAADGRRLAGRLAPGSVVLAHVAWLRVARPAGWPWGELLRRQDQDRDQWRRFQVICRHLTA